LPPCWLAAAAASSSASASSEAASSTASEAASTDASSTEEATASVDLGAIVTAIEAVNEVPNARAIDDFSMENEMNLTPDNIVAFQGDVTNDQADCALVFAAQVKDGTADAVKAELEAYKESMSSTLYADFADKVAKAQDARIVVKGNVVVMVIAGVNGPDYSAIDTAIDGALA
jgi:hypothetical protein